MKTLILCTFLTQNATGVVVVTISDHFTLNPPAEGEVSPGNFFRVAVEGSFTAVSDGNGSFLVENFGNFLTPQGRELGNHVFSPDFSVTLYNVTTDRSFGLTFPRFRANQDLTADFGFNVLAPVTIGENFFNAGDKLVFSGSGFGIESFGSLTRLEEIFRPGTYTNGGDAFAGAEDFQVVIVPEPSSTLLLALSGILLIRRRS